MRSEEKISDQELYDECHRLFRYEDGKIYNKGGLRCRKFDIEAGTMGSRGYRVAYTLGELMTVHRIIYLMHHKYLPDVLDHIDRVRDNNHIENLRPCTYEQNSWNSGPAKGAKYKGVLYRPKVDGKNWYAMDCDRIIDKFILESDAVKCYNKFILEKNGEFAYVNPIHPLVLEIDSILREQGFEGIKRVRKDGSGSHRCKGGEYKPSIKQMIKYAKRRIIYRLAERNGLTINFVNVNFGGTAGYYKSIKNKEYKMDKIRENAKRRSHLIASFRKHTL